MVPAILDGDRVLVAHGCAGVRRGDVLVFRLDGLLIAHRVLHVKDGDDGLKFVTSCTIWTPTGKRSFKPCAAMGCWALPTTT